MEGSAMNMAPDIISSERLEPGHLANDIVTEDSAALQFVERYGDNLRYCHSTGAWYRWSGVYWQRDRKHVAFHWARELARQLAVDLDENRRYTASKVAFAAGVERYAKAVPEIAVEADDWDRDTFLLGTPKGTVDLRTGELRPPSQIDGITKLTSVAPINGDCPQWRRFLEETSGGDTALTKFLQQWCGYCLTGDTREHALIFCYGPGGNGKSVFLNVVTKILHDYAVTAAMDTFAASRNEKHPTDLAMLRGARVVTASETEEGRAWAEARIKQMTGGDPITARFMRQDFFTFNPQFKLTIVGNHKPALHRVDDAAKRRFNVVPFIHKPEKPDRELEQKLMAEAGEILHWMIQGCLDWQQNGLCRPESVVRTTEEYFSDQDLFAQWLGEECDVEPNNHDLSEGSRTLFAAWRGYAIAAGHPPGNQQSFKDALTLRGIRFYRSNRAREYLGIRLRPQFRSFGKE
jgi:putative DNA primase/helicase